jgi:hypothetical protein
MIDEYGAVSGMRIGRRNRSTRTKPVPLPLSPPKIPPELSLCVKLHFSLSVADTLTSAEIQ